MVKIVRFHKFGDADVLQLDELPLAEPNQGEVRLKVEAIGLESIRGNVSTRCIFGRTR